MPCLICGSGPLRDFAGRRGAYCESCRSLERHRALVRLFGDLFAEGNGRCLEVGPVSPVVFGGYLRERGWEYASIDQSARGNAHDPRDVHFVDREADLTDLTGVPDGEFDLVIAQHVIEEIPEFERALDEVARVTEADGVALLEIPHDLGRERSERHAPDDFGNVWRFGRDLQGHLETRFASVQRVAFEEGDYRGAVFRCVSRGRSYGERVAAAWGREQDPAVRSFWQSPVVVGEINRRLTGSVDVDPVRFFQQHFCDPPRRNALSLGCGGGDLELRFVTSGACERIVGVDIAPERVLAATGKVPPELADRVRFEVRDLESWKPQEKYELIVAQDILHHIDDLERWCAIIAGALADDGLLYVHDFIGRPRFQWSDRQLMIINRLLNRLPDRLRTDLVEGDGTLREVVGRPDVERFIAEDPSEAIDPQSIPRLLERHLTPVHVHPYGGGVFHQFFNRIMGNFGDDPELVKTIMEIDFILTDLGAIEPDYLWGVYRP
ncbi:MAG TPA: class I SAM-dependent methyltransferase [Solirubrobacterales bacterium]